MLAADHASGPVFDPRLGKFTASSPSGR